MGNTFFKTFIFHAHHKNTIYIINKKTLTRNRISDFSINQTILYFEFIFPVNIMNLKRNAVYSKKIFLYIPDQNLYKYNVLFVFSKIHGKK